MQLPCFFVFVHSPLRSPSGPNPALSPNTPRAQQVFLFSFISSAHFYLASLLLALYLLLITLMRIDRRWDLRGHTHTHAYTERITLEFHIHLNSVLLAAPLSLSSMPPQLLAWKVMLVPIATVCVCIRQEFPYTEYKGCRARGVTKSHTLRCGIVD